MTKIALEPFDEDIIGTLRRAIEEVQKFGNGFEVAFALREALSEKISGYVAPLEYIIATAPEDRK